ncbi:hypothetical protein F5148DRAFT_1309864 [Russula earlei]|uniref:Uncharacterized protein n=1 Tax=Russula earlei TaxID=71964 RepID=A0ACC0U6U8_9AGAM|nr:hypothetical protein F5148DRAFT_1309864 [Russula earlei]
MLSLALKVVWLVFAVLGVPATWFVFIPFASAIGTYWASILYCITVTVLEIAFCLGMIWRMIPSNMPHSFCVVQTVIIALSFHVLTGVVGCFTWASYLTVFKPYSSIQASASALLWRRAYFLFVVAFPLLAFTAHLTAVLKTNSVHPANAMHCDNTYPLWPRLLGYAGAPIVLFTPCFVLSIVTALRICRMHAKVRELQAKESESIRALDGGSHGQTGAAVDVQPAPQIDSLFFACLASDDLQEPLRRALRPLVSRSIYLHFLHCAYPPLIYITRPHHRRPKLRVPLTVVRDRTPSPIVFADAPLPTPHRNHVQLDAAGKPCNNCCTLCNYREPGITLPPEATVSGEPPASPTSLSRAPISLEINERMPRFHLPTRPPPNGLRPSLELSPEYVRARLEEDRAIFAGGLGHLPASPYSYYRTPSAGRSPDIAASLPSISYTDHALERLPEVDEGDKGSIAKSEGDLPDQRKTMSMDYPEPPRLKPIRQFYRSAPRPSVGRPPGLNPPIWRMVVFQMIFFFILILASLSTLIDLVRDPQAPVAFGTQHVAILLVVWCPPIVFGSSEQASVSKSV